MKLLISQCKSTISMVLITSSCLLSCSDNNIPTQPTQPVSPKANFNFSGNQERGSEIQFTNLSENANSFNWNFGNGITSDKKDPGKIKYEQTGVYEIMLVALNGNQRDVHKKSIVIAQNNEPMSHFSYIFKDGKNYAPAKIILKNESLNANQYEWEIDGVSRNERDPENIVFNSPGDYRIKLTASQAGRKSIPFEQVIHVAANDNPIAYFLMAYHPYPYQVGEDIQVVNQSKNADHWQWTFESGVPAQSTEQHPTVKFPTPGNHKITLVAKKANISSAATVITLKINP